MNTDHADKIADLCEIDGVDHKYYGVYELFESGKISCAGILQHYCVADMHKQILNNQYEYCEIYPKPTVIIKEMNNQVIHNYMIKEFYELWKD